MNLLKLDNLSYRYSDALEDEYVLKNINMSFEKGKVYAIKGKSGSGKTTLLSLISGLEKNYEGKILYADEELSKMDLDKYRNTDVGIVFQSYNLLPSYTALENIILSMDINNSKNIDKRKKALELMKQVGLKEEQADRMVLRLSGGEQQRIAIAGNLDKDTENQILNILISLAHDDDKCVIIVTHSENVCNRADVVYDLKKINGRK